VGGDDLQKLTEARRSEDGQRRLVDPALARQIAAADRDQVAVFEIDSVDLAALALVEEMLEIDHAVADLAGRRMQQAQRLGMLIEEIRVAAQIGDDLAAVYLALGYLSLGDFFPPGYLARDIGRRGGVARGPRLVARTVNHRMHQLLLRCCACDAPACGRV